MNSYNRMKALILGDARLPLLGQHYRLLADDFDCAWCLVEVYIPKCPTSYAYSFRSKEGSLITIQESLGASYGDWTDKVKHGEIVVDGEDLPPGAVHDWAYRTNNTYILALAARNAFARIKLLGENKIVSTQITYPGRRKRAPSTTALRVRAQAHVEGLRLQRLRTRGRTRG